ncbi:MAG: DNA adenine methylase [bacterium]
MKPIIKWSGGKSKEIKFFNSYYPENFKRFIEPFVGGGAVFFDLNFDGENVINDIHPNLINFYKQIKLGNSEEIYNLMSEYDNDEKTYYFIRDKFIPSNEIEQAFRFFYLRKTCFRGMLRYNKSGKFNIPFGRYKTFNYEILKEKEYENLLKKTDIMFGDVLKVFEKYNNEENFMFLDPPYDSVFTDYGYCKYEKRNHEELAKAFKETKNKCLMIIGETPFINDLYRDYIKTKFHKKYAFKIYNGRVGDEIDNYHLIITNY